MSENATPVKLSIERCKGTFKDPGYGNIILLKDIDPYTQKVFPRLMMKCFIDNADNKDIYYYSLTKLYVATDMEMAYFLSQTDELDFFKVGAIISNIDKEKDTYKFGELPLRCIYYDMRTENVYIKIKPFSTMVNSQFNSIRLTKGRFVDTNLSDKVVPLFIL